MPRLRTADPLILDRDGDEVSIANPHHKTGMSGPKELTRVLDFFRASADSAAFLRAHPDVDAGVIDELQRAFILIVEDEYSFLQRGFVAPAETPFGNATSLEALTNEEQGRRAFALLGAPSDAEATALSREGPRLVRRALRDFDVWGRNAQGHQPLLMDFELHQLYDLTDVRVEDVGDVVWAPGEPLQRFGQRLSKALRAILEAQFVPLLLGGDHSLTALSLPIMLERYPGLGVIHFDAHHDHYLPYSDDVSALTHANPFFFVTRHPGLRRLHQVGLRTLERVPQHSTFLHDDRFSYVSSYDLRRMTPTEVFAGLPQDIRYYVTFDIDCVSPVIAPETGAPALGGMDFYQGLELMEHVSKRFDIVGADFVEVADRTASVNWAATVTARYLMQVVCGAARRKPLQAHLLGRQP
jgi:agmatinase